jgi:tyrosine-protein kinase Etk/Wzc
MQEEQHTASCAGPEAATPMAYLEAVLRRWRLVVSVSVAAFAVSTAVAFSLPKVYSSTALILPPQQDSGMIGMMSAMTGGMASLAGDLLGKGNSSDLYVGLLHTQAVKDAVIDRFKLMEVYDQSYRLDTYRALEQRTEIAAGKKDGIISITVEDRDPKRAAQLANAFVEELGKLTVRLSVKGAGQSRGYLEERLAQAKGDLARAEEAMKNFQSRNKALDVPEQAKAAIIGVAQLKAQLAVQQAQLAAMRSRFTDSTQEVRDIKASIASIQGQLEREEGRTTGSSIPSVGAVPELGQEYVRLMREFKVQETIVELLTKQYEMARFTEGKDLPGMQIVQQATVPDKKIKPKRGVVILMATLASFLFAVIHLVFQEFLKTVPEEKLVRWRMLTARGSSDS